MLQLRSFDSYVLAGLEVLSDMLTEGRRESQLEITENRSWSNGRCTDVIYSSKPDNSQGWKVGIVT
jgi:hypothetical protein